MAFRLLIIDHVCGEDYKHPCYACVGSNYKTREAAQAAKKSYTSHRAGVVKSARALAKHGNIRSPWKIEEG